MRINSIGTYQTQSVLQRNVVKNNIRHSDEIGSVDKEQLAFKGYGGKVFGGIFGAGLAGLCTLAAMATPVGWAAAVTTLLTSEIGGAVIGGAVGDKIEGKTEEDKNGKD